MATSLFVAAGGSPKQCAGAPCHARGGHNGRKRNKPSGASKYSIKLRLPARRRAFCHDKWQSAREISQSRSAGLRSGTGRQESGAGGLQSEPVGLAAQGGGLQSEHVRLRSAFRRFPSTIRGRPSSNGRFQSVGDGFQPVDVDRSGAKKRRRRSKTPAQGCAHQARYPGETVTWFLLTLKA